MNVELFNVIKKSYRYLTYPQQIGHEPYAHIAGSCAGIAGVLSDLPVGVEVVIEKAPREEKTETYPEYPRYAVEHRSVEMMGSYANIRLLHTVDHLQNMVRYGTVGKTEVITAKADDTLLTSIKFGTLSTYLRKEKPFQPEFAYYKNKKYTILNTTQEELIEVIKFVHKGKYLALIVQDYPDRPEHTQFTDFEPIMQKLGWRVEFLSDRFNNRTHEGLQDYLRFAIVYAV